jgi:hypothetical protein
MSHKVCLPFRLMTRELAVVTITTQNMSFGLPFKTKKSSMTARVPYHCMSLIVALRATGRCGGNGQNNSSTN